MTIDSTIQIICVQVHDIFTWFTIIITFHAFVIGFTVSFISKILPLVPFSRKKYMSMSEISSNFVLVILSNLKRCVPTKSRTAKIIHGSNP